MVKELIKGLLGKKGDSAAKEGNPPPKEEKKEDEVPDELPALAEDTVAAEEKPAEKEASKEAEKPAEDKKEEPKGAEKPAEDKKEEPKGAEKPAEEKEEKDDKGDDLLKQFEEYKEEFKGGKKETKEKPAAEKKEAKEKPAEKEAPKEAKEKPVGHKKEAAAEYTELKKELPEDERGFFSELLSITKKYGVNEGILNQDLLKRMKDHWYYHQHEKGTNKNRDQLQKSLLEELLRLKRAEERWITQKRFIEEDKRILLEKEREIEIKTKEVQKILNQLSFYYDVPPYQNFWLNNGMSAKNLHELMDLLDVIDDKTFNHHLNGRRNDFSHWIRDVVKDEGLAKKVSLARTREELLVILENASVGNNYIIDPDSYFKLGNGEVIKDIRELLFTLRNISNSEFREHVNNKRNDFSMWVRHAFKNDYLADKLQAAKSKEDMVGVLEDFFRP